METRAKRRQLTGGAALLMLAGAAMVARHHAPVEGGAALKTVSLNAARGIRHDTQRRSIVELEAPDGSWVAVWCYLPRVKLRTVYSWQRNQSVRERVTQLSRESGSGDEWAAINGGYFDWNHHVQPTRAIIGSVGNGRAGAWSHGSPPSSGGRRFRRWAWSAKQSGGETRFQSALMEPRVGVAGFWVPPRLESAPFGLSGLLCLLHNGAAEVWRDASGATHAEPAGQWNGRTRFVGLDYRWAALAWSADGRHLFLLVQRAPAPLLAMRDLFARYQGRRYVGAGPVLARLQIAFARLPAAERPCAFSELPTRVASAFLLDGGQCATLKYRRSEGGRMRDWGSWQTGPRWKRRSVAVPTTIEVSER